MTYITWVAALMITGYWLFQIRVRKDYQNKGKLSPVSSLLELLFFAFHANMMYAFIPVSWGRLPPLSEHPFLHDLSLISIILGLFILAVSMVPLGFQRTMGLRSIHLQTRGLYRISRNPQVIGYSFLLIGYVISYFSMYSIGWLAVFIINILWMIRAEEEFLHKRFGEEYESYCRKVPRFLDARSFRNLMELI